MVSAMVDNVQRCVICGEIIADHRNVLYPKDSGPPWAWPPGEIFTQGINPKSFFGQLPPGENAEDCGVILKVNRNE